MQVFMVIITPTYLPKESTVFNSFIALLIYQDVFIGEKFIGYILVKFEVIPPYNFLNGLFLTLST